MTERLGRMAVAFTSGGDLVTAADLRVEGAMGVLLRDALSPNLVQTLEGGPAFVHGGPFGNIAHGCNSRIATKTALGLGDVVVTEAGFGSDLGAEKFFNIKCRAAGLDPKAAVIVATIRALRHHGGVPAAELSRANVAAVQRGLANLEQHVHIVRRHNECLNSSRCPKMRHPPRSKKRSTIGRLAYRLRGRNLARPAGDSQHAIGGVRREGKKRVKR